MVSQLVATDEDSRDLQPVVAAAPGGGLTRLEAFFSRIQPLRMMVLGGLRRPYDPADAALLFERIAADIAASFPDSAAEIARLRQAFQRVPELRDPNQQVSRARGLVDELTASLVAIENDMDRMGDLRQTRFSVRNHAGWLLIAAVLCLILAARSAYDPLFIGRFVFPHREQRLADLAQLRDAIDRYRVDHGTFPISADNGSSWNGIGWSGDPERWIPALVPDYLTSLPRDPRQDGNAYNQYIYKSNGADYKLLALVPEDCQYTVKHSPSLADGPRNVYNQCYAYGYWTAQAKPW
jgi:hypothetical protein